MIIKQKPGDFVVEEVINLDKKPGDYHYFKLTKKNRNTLDVIKEIARKVPRKDISFAGTKDKIAITTQYLSIYKRKPKIDLDNVELEYISSGSKPINLGDLKGNNFKIKINFTPKKITQIKNYFGPQRFGKNNKEVGKAILKKDFKEATKLLELEVKNNNYLESLKRIDKKLLSLYISAYQSYLWNKLAEKINKNQEIPLISFTTTEKYMELMKKEGITKKDLILKQLPDLTPLQTTRPLFVELKNFKFKKPYVSFFLPKGSYATIALEQMQ